MKRFLSLTCAAVLMVAVSIVAARAADDTPMPSEGQAAPTFTLPSQDGSPISLNQYHGARPN